MLACLTIKNNIFFSSAKETFKKLKTFITQLMNNLIRIEENYTNNSSGQ